MFGRKHTAIAPTSRLSLYARSNCRCKSGMTVREAVTSSCSNSASKGGSEKVAESKQESESERHPAGHTLAELLVHMRPPH